MGKKADSPPPAPDPVATAQAQSQYNRQAAIDNAALNRINTITPWGSDTYKITGTGPDGLPTYERNISLSPDQQAALDASNKITKSANDLALAQFSRVNDTLGTKWDTSGLPAAATGVAFDMGNIQNSLPGAGNIQRLVAQPQRQVQYDIADAGSIQRDIGDVGNIQMRSQPGRIGLQGDLSFNRAPALVGGDTLARVGQGVSDAIYGSAKRNLDPRYEQEERQVANDLANRGIPVGSAAFDTAMSNFRQSRDSAYADAQDRATQGAVSAANTLFGQGLAARQQGVSEATTQGQFRNAAQGQEFGQNATSMQLANAAQAQQFAQQQARQQALNQAQQQQFTQNLARGEFGNQATAQDFGQNLASMQADNAAQAQQFGQNATAMQLANAAQAQKFGQYFSVSQQNAALQNAARDRAYAEALQARELPLQETQSLMGTGSVQQPNFGSTPLVNYQAPNYESDVYNSANLAQQGYQAQQQANAQGMGGLFGALGGVGGGLLGLAGKSNLPTWLSFMSAASDRRVKQDIQRIGTANNGLPIYVFRYAHGGPTIIGFMADEVAQLHPDAVHEIGGIQHVDYARAVL